MLELEFMSVRLEPALDIVDPEMRISAAVPAFDMTFPPRCLSGCCPSVYLAPAFSPGQAHAEKYSDALHRIVREADARVGSGKDG
ncbi:MAG TPA: hypothetical protein VG475_11325 [Pseudolabrys sp.]|nr:hypothetical protein [Pseudolabrys sp.]